MWRLLRTLKLSFFSVMALAGLAALPSAVSAGGMGFKNDLNQPIVVRGGTIINVKGKPAIHPSKPLLIQPGKTAWDINLPKGDREIVIYLYDPQTSKLIETFRGILPYMGGDLFFHVQQGPPLPNAPPKTILKPHIPFGEMTK